MPPEHRHHVRLFLLGRFELRHGTHVILDDAWPRSKARALVKLLALQPGRVLPRESVYAALWPEASAKAAANNLYKNVHYLRTTLAQEGIAEPIGLSRHTVALNARFQVDVDRFRQDCATALASGEPDDLERALAPYGELLPGDAGEPWTREPRDALCALRAEALMALGSTLERRGEPGLAAARYEAFAAAHPAREDVHVALMRVYAASGQRDRALRQYDVCRQALRSAFGAAPSAATQKVYDALRSGAVVPGARDAAVIGAAPSSSAKSGPGTFVGREAELSGLRGALDDAVGGRGQIRLVSGEPGIGKTRLVEEFAEYAEAHGGEVLWGRCIEGNGAPAYWPWLQVLRGYAANRSSTQLRDALGVGAGAVAQLSLEIRAAVPEVAEPPHLEAEQARFRLFDGIGGLLQRASITTPLVVVLEDVHGADEPSLQLLRFVAREIRQARVVVVATYRDQDVQGSHPLIPVLAELTRERGCGRIALPRFAAGEVRAFIRVGSGVEPSDELVAELHQRTDGNALFVREMLRLFLSDPSARVDEPPKRELPVPESVRDVIGQRLALLSADCNRVLSVAAVFGREFVLAPLTRVMGRTQSDLLSVMQEAIDARVVVEQTRGDGRFVFTHALIRDTLYERLGVDDCVRLHRRIGEVIEATQTADPSRHVSELAHHFLVAASGGDGVDKAIEYATRAARHAESVLAYEQAALEYGRALRALDLQPAADDRKRCELLLAQAEAAKYAGEPGRAREACLRAAGIARALRDPVWLGRAALGYEGAGVTTGSADRALVTLLREALDAGELADAPLRSRLLGRLAMALYWTASSDIREELSLQSLQMARRIGEPAVLAYALKARHFSLGTEHIEERLGISREIVDMARQAEDREMEFGGHGTRLMDLLETGDIEGVDREMTALMHLAEELRQPLHVWARTVRQSMRATLAGRFAEGEQFARDAVSAGLRSMDPNVLPWFGVQMVSVCSETGRMGELEAPINSYIEQFPAVQAWRTARALMLAQAGRDAEAREEFERVAAGDFAGLARDGTWIGAVTVCCRVAAYLGDAGRAAVLHRLLSPYAGRTVVVAAGIACWGAVSRYLAVCSVLLRRWDAAEREFDAAMDMNARMGATPYLAHTQQEYAWMLLERRAEGDLERARALLAAASETAEALSMTSLAHWCAEIRAREGWPGAGGVPA